MNAVVLGSRLFSPSTRSYSGSTSSASIRVRSAANARRYLAGDKGAIVGCALGGVTLALLCLWIILFPIWRRRRGAQPGGTPDSNPIHLSKPSPSPISPPIDMELHTVRPVTPSHRRLATEASAPSSAHPLGTVSMRWDVEKARVHTPSGHPATGWRGNIFGNKSPAGSRLEDPQVRQPESSISTTFAAEMSSLLESISIKSSYSSLRSGGAVLGVPAQLHTPLSVQKLRQDSCATTVGATRGSVSGRDGVEPGPMSTVLSRPSPENTRPRVEKGSSEDVYGV